MRSAIGFFLGFRIILMVLAVRLFDLDPQTGMVATLLLNFLLFAVLAFTPSGEGTDRQRLLRQPAARWVLAFLIFSGMSLFWTAAVSLPAAVAFWAAMVADSAMLFLLVTRGEIEEHVSSFMTGFIYGACVVSVVAWILPSQSDLRLGDEELLGPNQIGYLCGLALFFAQYLIRKGHPGLKLSALFLLFTLLRSLSKTTILAFLAAQIILLVRDRSLSRRTKVLLIAGGLAVAAAFSGLLVDYVEVYLNRGNESITLTGRVTIWAYILNEALQQPWIGHGFHSVWKVIPPLNGGFEARHAHNELLQQFYAYGVAGVVLLVGVYSAFYLQIRRIHDPRLRVFLSSVLLFVLVRGLTDTEVFDLSLPLWSILMWSAVMTRQTEAGITDPEAQPAGSPHFLQLSPECNF